MSEKDRVSDFIKNIEESLKKMSKYNNKRDILGGQNINITNNPLRDLMQSFNIPDVN